MKKFIVIYHATPEAMEQTQSMSPEELRTKLDESKKKLEGLGKQESDLQTDGE